MIRKRTPVADPKAVGIAALQFLVTDDDLIMRFLAMSGLQADELRAAAGQPDSSLACSTSFWRTSRR